MLFEFSLETAAPACPPAELMFDIVGIIDAYCPRGQRMVKNTSERSPSTWSVQFENRAPELKLRPKMFEKWS